MNCIKEQRKYRKLASRRLMADNRILENIFRLETGIRSEMAKLPVPGWQYAASTVLDLLESCLTSSFQNKSQEKSALTGQGEAASLPACTTTAGRGSRTARGKTNLQPSSPAALTPYRQLGQVSCLSVKTFPQVEKMPDHYLPAVAGEAGRKGRRCIHVLR